MIVPSKELLALLAQPGHRAFWHMAYSLEAGSKAHADRTRNICGMLNNGKWSVNL